MERSGAHGVDALDALDVCMEIYHMRAAVDGGEVARTASMYVGSPRVSPSST
jgi:hypothetical protein